MSIVPDLRGNYPQTDKKSRRAVPDLVSLGHDATSVASHRVESIEAICATLFEPSSLRDHSHGKVRHLHQGRRKNCPCERFRASTTRHCSLYLAPAALRVPGP